LDGSQVTLPCQDIFIQGYTDEMYLSEKLFEIPIIPYPPFQIIGFWLEYVHTRHNRKKCYLWKMNGCDKLRKNNDVTKVSGENPESINA
jgi:hypothetical protein